MERLATGLWLDRGLARFAALGCLALTLLMIGLCLMDRVGTLDQWGRPLGTDFSGIYAAGHLALQGNAAGVYDWAIHGAAQRALQGSADVPFFPWHYPPVFFLVAAPLALLPYLPALVAWQLATMAALLAVLWRILPGRDTPIVALGCPVVFVCVAHGQNGFLTAALFGAGLLALERRPLLGGLLLGCLCYKPQLGLVIPIVLAAGGYWRACLGSALAVLALCGATLLLFGPDVWTQFVASLPDARRVTIEESGTGWYKLVSAYAYVRFMDGSPALASLVQGVVGAGALAGAAWLWWRRAAFPLRAAAAILATILATPYLLDYDLALLGPAIAFLVAHGLRHGFARWEATLLAGAWVVPVASRHLVFFAHLPGAFMVVAGLLLATVMRARAERRVLRDDVFAAPAALIAVP